MTPELISSAALPPRATRRPPVPRLLHFSATLPARALLGLLWIYQRTISPLLPVVTGGACGCRFAPTCSHYAVEAIRTHGAAAGSLLAVRRLLKCTPLHPGGLDPVPPRRVPRCTRPLSPLVSRP